jgi:hypothetical protein
MKRTLPVTWPMGLLLAPLLVSVLARSAGAQGSRPPARDTAPIATAPALTPAQRRHALEAMLGRQLLAQRGVWQAEEGRAHGVLRHPQNAEPGMQRLSMVHCHTDRRYAPSSPMESPVRDRSSKTPPPRPPAYPVPTLIESAAYKTAMCPNWMVPASEDDPSHIAAHRAVSAPAHVVPFSDSLIAALDHAAAQHPSEAWFTRQLVRVLTENGDLAGAAFVAQRCRPEAVTWCAALQTYVLYTSGQMEAAAKAYHALLPRLDTDVRCRVRSAERLLPPANAASYRRIPCAARGTVDDTLWWLATPLFADGLNLRELEHFARAVRSDLVRELPLDAHHDLRVERGGDAIAEMRTRYGWPQHLVWAGAEEDKAHTHYDGADNAPPFPAVEYSRASSPTLASWRAVLNPFTLSDTDYGSRPSSTFTATSWWPQEFFLHPRGVITTLPETQRALLRRDSSALIVVASARTDANGMPATGTTGEAFLVHSSGPDTVLLLDQQSVQREGRFFLQGLARRAGVVSVEYLPTRVGVGAERSRFGITAEALRSLGDGACAVSEPMLLDAASVRRRGFIDIEEGLLGSVQLQRPRTIGVAWESYGFAPRDSVNVTVRISGAAAQNALQRTGRLFGLGADPRVGLAISWREPNPLYVVLALDGQTPTLLRELSVDIGALRTGAYALEISMERRGCSAVQSARTFSVTR